MTKRLYRTAHCYRCGYVWRMRKRSPRICARCKSPKFSIPKIYIPTYGSGVGIEEVLDPHREAIAHLSKKYGASLSAFGSVARRAAGTASDIDLLVDYRRPVDLLTHTRFRRDLEAAIGRRVDLVAEDSLHWLVQPQVVMEAVPV